MEQSNFDLFGSFGVEYDRVAFVEQLKVRKKRRLHVVWDGGSCGKLSIDEPFDLLFIEVHCCCKYVSLF